MPKWLQIAAFNALAVLMLVGLALPANAAAPSVDTKASSILPEAKNATALVDQLIGTVNNLGNYKFEGSQEACNGSNILKASGTFYFKPANAMRVEVKEYGIKSGSTLVKSPDGNIKAKGGPQMFGMKMRLEPDSRLLQMPNGLSAVECDLASLLRRLKKDASTGCKMVSGSEPISVDGLGERVIVLESQRDMDAGTALVDRIFIDPSKKLPLQWDMFENGTFRSRSKFQNYETNLQLDDSQFKL